MRCDATWPIIVAQMIRINDPYVQACCGVLQAAAASQAAGLAQRLLRGGYPARLDKLDGAAAAVEAAIAPADATPDNTYHPAGDLLPTPGAGAGTGPGSHARGTLPVQRHL